MKILTYFNSSISKGKSVINMKLSVLVYVFNGFVWNVRRIRKTAFLLLQYKTTTSKVVFVFHFFGCLKKSEIKYSEKY